MRVLVLGMFDTTNKKISYVMNSITGRKINFYVTFKASCVVGSTSSSTCQTTTQTPGNYSLVNSSFS